MDWSFTRARPDLSHHAWSDGFQRFWHKPPGSKNLFLSKSERPMNTSIPFAIAFTAGLASFLSPCVLPLVPIYLAQLVGPSVIQSTDQRAPSMRLYTFLHALCF